MTTASNIKRNLQQRASEVKSAAGRAIDAYEAASEKAPETKLAFDLHPKTGILTSAMDAAVKAKKGDYKGAAIEAVGVIPGVRPGVALAKKGMQAAKSKALRSEAATNARVFDRTNDVGSYAMDKVSGMANGGMVCSRDYGKKK